MLLLVEVALNQRVNAIDGLRAIAMTMVIAQHSGILPMGWAGVWLFFVISGYVITRGFLSEERRLPSTVQPHARYAAFLKRRVLRIFPAYFLYLCICGLLSMQASGRTLADLLGLVSFTYNWQMIYFDYEHARPWVGVGHLWTLSVEQQFYIFFPLLFLWVPERMRWKLATLLILLAPAIRFGWVSLNQWSHPLSDDAFLAFAVYAATHCQADAFLMGALLARYEGDLRSTRQLPTRAMYAALGLTSAYMLSYVVANHLRGDHGLGLVKNIISGTLYGQGRETLVYSVMGILSTAIMLQTLSGARYTQWLSHRFLTWVGQVSYGGYLFHVLPLAWISAAIGGELKTAPLGVRLGAFAITWAASVLLASMSFKYFEQPVAQKWKNWAKL